MSSFNRLFPGKREKQAENWDKNSAGLLMIKYDQKETEDSLSKRLRDGPRDRD